MNKLAKESSLYLQQHADNPVEWWPWGDAALQAARSQNKPILLSIGYAACHWCHVMAHESFENETIAELMNQRFINIKVDREQRPDLDRLYQTAHQLIIQRPGGWPLTMFLTPEAQLPFFGGTYFPPEPRQGMPGFADVLTKVAEFHAANPAEAARQGAAVQDVFSKLEPAEASGKVQPDALADALRTELASHADKTNGGFGKAPKFPQIPSLLRLLHHWRASAHQAEPDVDALFMAALAQTRMAEGGLMDQVGGGFFRYCVDTNWQIPHFEKMLYDNAQLLQLYAETAQATGEGLFVATAESIASWLTDTLQDEQGGFYSAIDADSSGVEGAFYTWSIEELRACLTDEDFALCFEYFGLEQAANFEGRWHLTVSQPSEIIAESLSLTAEQFATRLRLIKETLATTRAARQAPAIDRKVLTAPNGLAIKALAIAARSQGREDWLQEASRCIEFLRAHAIKNGRVFASWSDGRAEFSGYLDDYVFVIDALLELLQCEWRDAWLEAAITLTDSILEHFEDKERGGFFFTANDHEALLYRQKPIGDEAMPAGNAIALRVLLRLGYLLGETRYLEAADRLVQFAEPAVREFPQAHVTLIDAIAESANPAEFIILRGDPDITAQWQRDLQAVYAPTRCVLAIPDSNDLPTALKDKQSPSQGAIAYVCQGTSCLASIDNWQDLAAAVKSR